MSESYVSNIDVDEIRDGFLVSARRKSIWNKEIEIMLEFDRICKKHNIQWFTYAGTTLGAIRHEGFIPWDDDIDVVLLRPDYEKFKEVVQNELKEGYFFQSIYTDEQIFTFSKLMDERTSAVDLTKKKDTHQGIFIDIFPLDIVASWNKDDDDEKLQNLLTASDELLATIVLPNGLVEEINVKGYEPVIGINNVVALLKMTVRERCYNYEKYLLQHYSATDNIGFHGLYANNHYPTRKKNWYRNVVMMPFENIQVPVPNGYENDMNINFGPNWRKKIKGRSLHNGILLNPDIPYTKLQSIIQKYIDEKTSILGIHRQDRINALLDGISPLTLDEKYKLEVPKDWVNLIKKADGSNKKVVLFHNNIAGLLCREDEMLEKYKYILKSFKDKRDDICLLWWPSPLIEAALKATAPDLWKKYDDLVSKFCSEGWGIYDTSLDLEKAVTLCNEYYGDDSNMVPLLRKYKKPVKIQNPENFNEL